MSVLYIFLAPLFFYVLSKRINLLNFYMKRQDKEKTKINLFFLLLIIIVQIIIVLAIELI